MLFVTPRCLIVQVMKEVETAGDKIILFIDELHVMVGAGGSDGAIDASNILKPSLARGKLRCLGATTTDEYAKHIEKDPALARRFQQVYIPEPSAAHTVDILRGLRDKYETHHRVLIPDAAIDVAVQLTGRYLTAKKFPDKAIDLLDESMSRIRNRRERKPASLVETEKRLNALLHDPECTTDAAGDGRSISFGRTANPVVEDCIRECNSIVNGNNSSGLSKEILVEPTSHAASALGQQQLSVSDLTRSLVAQCEGITAVWHSRNSSIDSIFEARTILADCLEKQRVLRKSGGVDADNFLKRRIERKEGELQQLCEALVRTVDTPVQLPVLPLIADTNTGNIVICPGRVILTRQLPTAH